MKWGHDQLAHDLAEYLMQNSDRIIWTDMQLGSAGSPRPDVYTIPKSYANFKPIAYECKVSVADFRSDITKGKWQSYLKFASGVIFAVPKGLVSKEDIPKGCGLIVRSEKGWRMVKGPTLLPVKNDLSADFWNKLVIDGVDRSLGRHRKMTMNLYTVHNQIEKKYGKELAYLLSDFDTAKSRLETKTKYLQEKINQLDVFKAAEHYKRELDELEIVKKELCDLLGLHHNVAIWTIKRRLSEKMQLLDVDQTVYKMKGVVESSINHMERQVRDLKSLLEPVFDTKGDL